VLQCVAVCHSKMALPRARHSVNCKCQLDEYAATLGNMLQHTATHCSTLQHTAAHCTTLHHTATHCNTLQQLQHTAAHCNTLQHTATRCNTLQHTATHCNALTPVNRKSQLATMGWRRCTGCLTFIGHFPQKNPIINGTFAERDLRRRCTGCLTFVGQFLQKNPIISGSFAERVLQLKASSASSAPSRLAKENCIKAVFREFLIPATVTHCNRLQHIVTHCNTL